MFKSPSITKKENRFNRHRRIRSRAIGVGDLPRFSVFRSNKHLVLQLIDDSCGKTLVSARDQELDKKIAATKEQTPRVAKGFALGAVLAEKAKKAGIKKVVFDRGGYLYHGVVKAIADGARSGGLEF
jgi:large subunit ribosomal protein L18